VLDRSNRARDATVLRAERLDERGTPTKSLSKDLKPPDVSGGFSFFATPGDFTYAET